MIAKNLDREMTVTPCRDKNDKTSLSSVISLSPVTRYFALPRIAVSMMISSSGSRQQSMVLFSSSMCSAFLIMERIKSSTLFSSRRYLFVNCERDKTSYNSEVCSSEIMSLNLSIFHNSMSLAADPKGATKAETHIFVSTTALTDTSSIADFIYSLFYVCFDFRRRKARSFSAYGFESPIKFYLPVLIIEYLYLHLLLVLKAKLFCRLKNAAFKNSIYYFRHDFIASYLNKIYHINDSPVKTKEIYE